MARLHGLADRVLARMVGAKPNACEWFSCGGDCIRYCCDGSCGPCACP
ncbi:hypothetical protein LX16_4567 [Stackebrandtia albiflava]|uniref:Uncharacterized protein n=1 Tax=Stackebrandtia albiflava TaxID=406432 RepID=A0A562URU9_9ACTN|nr:hypothetical protein [Stackebrandtia albiflava]TWJ08339.1 hypothetical protein LX16_4567 [Stackebrandtia albiflava]